MKTTVSLKYFVIDSLLKPFFNDNSSRDPLKLNFFGNFGNSKSFHTVLT